MSFQNFALALQADEDKNPFLEAWYGSEREHTTTRLVVIKLLITSLSLLIILVTLQVM